MSKSLRKLSEEHKKKIGLGNLGKKVSKETREKIRLSHLGRELSKETKCKISEALKNKQNVKGRFQKGHIPQRTKESYIEQGRIRKERIKNDSEYRRKVLENIKKAQGARRGNPAWNSGKKLGKHILKNPKTGHPYNWRGGRIKRNSYVFIWDEKQQKYISEHRKIMENYLGRKLEANEIINHFNGVKDDNRIENLQIKLRATHEGKVNCPFCRKEFLVQ